MSGLALLLALLGLPYLAFRVACLPRSAELWVEAGRAALISLPLCLLAFVVVTTGGLERFLPAWWRLVSAKTAAFLTVALAIWGVVLWRRWSQPSPSG